MAPPPLLTLQDIDPVLADRLAKHVSTVQAAFHTMSASSDENSLQAALERLHRSIDRMERRVLLGCFVAAVVLYGAGCTIWDGTKINSSVQIFFLIFSPVFIAFILQVLLGAALKRSVVLRHQADLLRAGLPEVVRTRPEALYANLVATLVRDTAITGEQQRETLSQAKRLMTEAHSLEKVLTDLRDARGVNTVFGLERERDGLLYQAADTTDPTVREALQQSAALCESRITATRSLTEWEERLNAQQEVLCQSLAVLQSAAAHRSLVPTAPVLAPPELAADVASQAAGQARAAEEAVREISAIQVGGR